jgi:AraC-like DNA-binding protein
MLSSALLLDTPSFRVRDVHCAHGRGGWAAAETSTRSVIVFARRGAFRRRGRHGEEVIEPGVAYFQRAGEEHEFAHPHDGGDRCTAVAVEDGLLATLLGGDPTLPAGPVVVAPRLSRGLEGGAPAALAPRPVATTPRDDLAHRLLAAGPEDVASAEERALGLVASVLAAVAPSRVAAGRPATARARRRAADDAREALAIDPSLGLLDLARAVAVSPHHLSRVFRDEVGVPVSTYRRRLRVRSALERLSGGESGLARLAADAGFADHAHLTREMRALLGTTPSALQREIARPLHQPG